MQPYVRKQLALATERASKMMELTSKDEVRARQKDTNESESCKVQTYVRRQLATARKLIEIIKIIIVKNHAYLLLTTFADPS